MTDDDKKKLEAMWLTTFYDGYRRALDHVLNTIGNPDYFAQIGVDRHDEVEADYIIDEVIDSVEELKKKLPPKPTDDVALPPNGDGSPKEGA